jgi:hypothetical protein
MNLQKNEEMKKSCYKVPGRPDPVAEWKLVKMHSFV